MSMMKLGCRARFASLLLLVPLVVPLLGISPDPAAGQSAIPKLIFSPWTKFCAADPAASGRPVSR
jgi:hypothetical protein